MNQKISYNPETDIKLPYNFTPRKYQIPMLTAREKGYKREVYILHRRAGKDIVALNDMIRAMVLRVGVYYYFFPTFAQGKKVIWKNITSEGRRYLSYFPEKLIKNKNDTEMRIELLNGSIFQVIGTDDFDSIRGTNPIGCIFSEYAKQNPEAWTTIIEPILLENGGWAKFLYTPYGKNHGYKLYQMAKNNPNWFTMLLTVNDTRKDDGSYVIPPEEIEELRKQGISEEIIQQEYYCSFNRGIEGAFYAKQMETVREEGRIREIPLDSSVPVHTAWDIGTGDSTAIVFFQKLPAEYHIIDYYENQGEGVQHYAKVLQNKGYVYGNHYGPHDLKARQWSQDGKPQIEVAREYNVNFQLVPRTSIENRHEAVRNILSKCYFNEKSSGVLMLIEHLENYSKKYNKIMQEYTSTPVHDKHSHGADAFGYFALAEKSEEIYLPIRRNFIDRDYLLRHCDEYSGL